MKMIVIFVLSLSIVGCKGELSANRAAEDAGTQSDALPDGTTKTVEIPETADVPASGIHSKLRRITPQQYRNAIRDVFDGHLSPGTFDSINTAVAGSGYSTEPAANIPTDGGIEQLFTSAEEMAISSVDIMDQLLPCAINAPGLPCVDTFIDQYAERAFRRPLAADERDLFRTQYTAAVSDGFSPSEATAILIQTVLQSGPFLYVAEVGLGEAEDGRIELNDFEIATRLSMLYADSVPDDRLWEAAVAGTLRDSETVAEHARRLFESNPTPLVRRFVREWLKLSPELSKSREAFPEFDEELEASIHEEIERFFIEAIERSVPFDQLLSSETGPVNARLAEFYGIENFPASETGWVNVTLPANYRGIFGRPLFHASHSGTADTSPTKRGYWILKRFLCSTPGSKPEGVEDLIPDYPDLATAREKSTILIDTRPACASCHRQIDSIGLSLENYDAIGKWRDLTPDYEGSRTIDRSGSIAEEGLVGMTDVAGQSFEGAQGLSSILGSSRDVQTCISRHWFRYAAHRLEQNITDGRLIAQMREASFEQSLGLGELFLSISQTDAFRFRQMEQQ